MKKRLLAALLTALVLLSFVSCGGQNKAKSLDLEAVKSSIEELGAYNSIFQPEDEMLKGVYGLDMNNIEELAAGVPLMNVQAGMYWVVLPKEGKVSAVKAAFDTYFTSYQKMWDSYLPEQAALVRAMVSDEIVTDKGTYLVYIIAEDTAAVRAAIDSALVY